MMEMQNRVCVCVTVFAVVWWARRSLSARVVAKALRRRAEEKLDARNTRRAAAKAVLPAFADIPEALRVSQMTVAELSAAMASGELTSELVVTIACARALQAGEELGCNAEERFLEAVEEAVLRDKQRAEGNVLGPLHGIPFSVKDQVHMAGFDSSSGLAARTFVPQTEDSLLVKILRDAGGVPFVRSNVPQGGMLPETANFIYGTTRNPYNKYRSSGGSSGGEGVLVATGASPLGIGVDCAGSLRHPACSCGVVGFAPTPQRMTQHGVDSLPAGLPAAGPLARCVADCDLAMQLWCSSMSNTDTTIPPQPWASQVKETRRLRFGVIRYDGFFPACTAVERAVDIAVEGLQRDGHEVVELSLPLSWNIHTMTHILSTKGRLLHETLQGEQAHPLFTVQRLFLALPDWLRTPLATCLHYTGCVRAAALLSAMHSQADVDVDMHAAAIIESMEDVDVVLSPQGALPAWRHWAGRHLGPALSYYTVWNNIGFPSGAVPVTYVTQGEGDGRNYATSFGDDLEHHARNTVHGSAGLPIGVVVASRPFADELCLAGMRAVERAVSFAHPAMDVTHATLRQGIA